MNRLHAALPIPVKMGVWNLKYRVLGYPHWVAPHDVVEYLTPRLSEHSFVLDLGCGRGSLLRALRDIGWNGCYCGVDISKHAIRDAQNIGDQRSAWRATAFESFSSPFKWNAIVMVESLCYVKQEEVSGFIDRQLRMLTAGGTFLVRLHDLRRHGAYVKIMQQTYPNTEKVAENLFIIAKAEPA